MSTQTAGWSVLLMAVVAGGAPAQSPSMDGVWRSQGYGHVFEIHGPTLNAFEVTNTTCVAGGTAAVDTTPVAGRIATFRTPGGGEMFVRAGGSADHKLLHSEGSASDERIDRIPRLPAVCDHPTADTPAGNFEVFTQTWAEHYISFDLKKTNWGKVVEANRSKVTSNTTATELFDILETMIGPFGDTHAFLAAPGIDRVVQRLRPGTDRVVKGGLQAFRRSGMATLLGVTDRTYLKTPLRNFCNDQIQYGHIDEATGYLRILSFSNYAKEGGFAAGLAALEAALDDIFSDRALGALVIDVRINGGGADPYGLAIASRLATSEYLAYTKEARADPVDRNKWTPGDPSRVRPSARPGFRGPTVELIGPLTISAGETFTQALMGRTPPITRIGENTQGVFSDVLSRRLPNGWRFGLPNEVFRTPRGTTFDGPGIPPDAAVLVFADEDVAAGKDPGVAKALEILRKKQSCWAMPSYKWRIVAMLWFISFFNYADRQAIFSVFPLLEREMHLTPVQLGLLGSGFAWVYGLGAPLAGMVVDRARRKTVILGGLHAWSLICLATGLSRNFRHLFLFRAAEGLGETFYFPASTSLISDYHGSPTRSRALGLHQTAVYMGTIGGGFFAGLIAESYGWRWSFVVFGGLGVLLGLVLTRFLIEPARGAADAAAWRETDARALGFGAFLRLLGRTPTLLCLLGAFMCANFVAVVLLSWMPKFLYDRFHMGLAMAGLTATIFVQLASMAGAPVGGWWADLWRRRSPRGRIAVQAVGVLGGAPFVVLCGVTQSVATLVVALTFWGFFKGLYDANIFASVFDVVPPEARGRAAGFMNLIGWLAGGGSAPLVIGIAAQRTSLGAAMALASIVYVAAGAFLIAGMMLLVNREAAQIA